MRVRGQTLIACFLFKFFIALHPCLHHTLPPSTLLKDAEPHQMQSILPFITYSSTLDTSCPPCSSFPPLLLPHLLLSVNPPVPVSHALMPSSSCDPPPSVKLLQPLLHSWCWHALLSPCVSAVTIALFPPF